MRMVAIVGSSEYRGEEAKAVVLEASHAFRQRQERAKAQRLSRLGHAPDRRSVRLAMFMVECELVKAYWVLARSTSNPGPRQQALHGISYMMDRDDKWAAAVAGGGWLSEPPKPAPPTSAEITAMDGPLEWLRFLEREQASIVAAGARSKQGDNGRRINWMRVRNQLPQCAAWSASRLRRTYDDGLRIIAGQVSA